MRMLVLTLIACNAKSDSTLDAPSDADTDTDSDTDSDTDTDTDTDSDADTDTDSGSTTETGSTGDTGISCLGVVNELEPFVEPRDANGPCTVCAAGPITFFAGIRNPCPMDIDVEVNLGCLVHQFSLSYPNGIGMGAAVDCTSNQQLITIVGGTSYEEQFYEENLTMSGNYAVQADLATYPVEQSVSNNFSIP